MSTTNTNVATLPDLNSFFLNQGKPVGYEPTDAEIEIAKAILVPVTKELMMRQFTPPKEAVGFGARTNETTKDVIRTIEYPDGSFKPYEPTMLQTTEGYQEMIAPGTTRTVTNKITGAPAMGYVASGSFYGAPQAMVGADNSAARAAAASATGAAPAPTPAPQPVTYTNAAGKVLRFNNIYDVRAALKANDIDQQEAVTIGTRFPLPGR